MMIDVQALQVQNNPEQNRFEVQLGDSLGTLTYQKQGSTYILVSTEVPEQFVGQGIAAHLVHDALEQIRAEHGKVVAQCTYVKAYLHKHPEYQMLVEDFPHD